MMDMAAASAEICLIDPAEYGVPPDVPQERVFRFSRVKAQPRGVGGGSAVLDAVLKILDEMGIWGVLEASPYPGYSKTALFAFYENHGFRHNPKKRGLMFRPPGGLSDADSA